MTAAQSFRRLLLIAAVLAAGCARAPREPLGQVWSRWSPNHWTAKPSDPDSNASPPAAAANAPAALSGMDAGLAPDSFESAFGSSASDAEPAFESQVPRLVKPTTLSGATTADKSAQNVSEPQTVSHSQAETLREALSKEAYQNETTRIWGLKAPDLRVRVDSLQAQARKLLALGKLPDARRLAHLASDMADRAGLDFSPADDRPEDLVREIEELEQPTIDADAPAAVATAESRAQVSADPLGDDLVLPAELPATQNVVEFPAEFSSPTPGTSAVSPPQPPRELQQVLANRSGRSMANSGFRAAARSAPVADVPTGNMLPPAEGIDLEVPALPGVDGAVAVAAANGPSMTSLPRSGLLATDAGTVGSATAMPALGDNSDTLMARRPLALQNPFADVEEPFENAIGVDALSAAVERPVAADAEELGWPVSIGSGLAFGAVCVLAVFFGVWVSAFLRRRQHPGERVT